MYIHLGTSVYWDLAILLPHPLIAVIYLFRQSTNTRNQSHLNLTLVLPTLHYSKILIRMIKATTLSL